jgi:hypothetical protein
MKTPHRIALGFCFSILCIALFRYLESGETQIRNLVEAKGNSIHQSTAIARTLGLDHLAQHKAESGVASAKDSAITPSSVDTDEAIGPEGYGPLVQKALDTRDPKLAKKAVNRIESCKYNKQIRQGVEDRLRSSAKVTPEKLKIVIEDLDRQGRFCQTLTPDLIQHSTELARIGVHGGESGLAYLYVTGIGRKIDTSEKSTVVAALVGDAMAGDIGALAYLVEHGAALEIAPIDRRSYFLAMQHRASTPHLELLEGLVGLGVRTPLPHHEEAEAVKRSKLIKTRD